MKENQIPRHMVPCAFFISIVIALAATEVGQAADDPLLVAPSEPLTPGEQLSRFHLPPGFEIQLVASEPDIQKPMNLAFDARGRLFASMSVEYPFPAEQDPRDTIRILEDFAPDGKAQRISTFADGLNIPIGVMPTAEGAIGYSIAKIWRFTDQNRDGRADERVPLYEGYGYRDTHGMTNSFTPWIDGWVYACHGYANTSVVEGRSGESIEMNSGNTYRFRRDGSAIEYFTHGQVNPFGMAFDAWGNAYTSDCHTLPAYMLLRGAWYPSFGKPHDGLGFGPPMMSHNHGSTGIAGIVYYEAEQFPKEYQDTLFIGNPVTGRINHDRLEPHGSTYQAIEQPDFLRCDDPWFRPVDLQLGPDGALYVADFYNRIIGHYEVPLTHPGRDRERGRIWRIVYAGAGSPTDQRALPGDLTRASTERLIELLGNSNLRVRTQATEQLVERAGQPAVEPALRSITNSDNEFRRAHAVWVIARLDSLDDSTMEKLAADPSALVRTHLVKALAERADWNSPNGSIASRVLAALDDGNAFVRRAAADALGRHPQARFIEPLLDIWRSTSADDTHLIHVARLALREHFRQAGAYREVRKMVKDRPELRDKVLDISLGLRNHDAASFVLDCLRDGPRPSNSLDSLFHFAARYCAEPNLAEVEELLLRLADEDGLDSETASVLEAVNRACEERGMPVGDSIRNQAAALATQMLASENDEKQHRGIQLAHRMRLDELGDELRTKAERGAPVPNRLAAISAVATIAPDRNAEFLWRLAADGREPSEIRQRAILALASIDSMEARRRLNELLTVVPSQLATLVAAGLAGSASGADMLLESVEKGRTSPRVLQEPLVSNRLAVLGSADVQHAVEVLTQSLPPPDQQIAMRIASIRTRYAAQDVDVSAGRAGFTKHCGICHQIAGEGANIGPQLDGVGNRGLERLLEDVINPNQNVDFTFQTTILATQDGQLISGLKLRDEGDVVVIADAAGKEIRIRSSEIETQRTTRLSPMPDNVADTLSEKELCDLLAYLLSQRREEE